MHKDTVILLAGAKALMYLRSSDAEPVPPGYDVCAGENLFYFPEGGCDVSILCKKFTREMMDARLCVKAADLREANRTGYAAGTRF